MTPDDLERRLSRDNVQPVSKEKYKGVYIYIAHAMRPGDNEVPTMHHLTCWATGLDEKLDVAQFFKTPLYASGKSGVEFKVDKLDVIKQATKDAKQWVRDNKAVKRY